MSIKKSLLLFVVVLSGCCQSNRTRPDLYPDYEQIVEPAFTFYAAGDHAHSLRFDDWSGRIQLEALSDYSPVYAVGPLSELQGEITIDGDHVSLVSLQEGQPMVQTELRGEAAFLAYATVTSWEVFTIYDNLLSLEALQAYVEEAAENAGLDTMQTFPFRIEAQVPVLDYHILFKQTPEQTHSEARQAFALSDADIRLTGFWFAVNDRGRYTHANSRIYTNFQMTDGSTSGHVDAIEIPRGAQLYLPIKTRSAANPQQ